MRKMRKSILCGIVCLLCSGLHAQSVKSVLSNIASSISNQTLDSPINDGNLVTFNKVKGTWIYDSPVVVYESKGVLGKASELLSGKTGKELDALLKKYNIEKDSVSMEFVDSVKLVCRVGKNAVEGTYALSGNVIQFSVGGQVVNGNVTVNEGTMQVLFTADRLYAFVKSINVKDVSDLKMAAITKLAGMKGKAQFGLTLGKKK